MQQRDLIGIFKDQGVVDAEDYPHGQALRLLAQIASRYERLGLLAGSQTKPLWKCCPHGPECWSSAKKPGRGSAVNDGRITLPWIGPRYERGGVVVVAINLHNAAGLLTEYAIACSSAGTPEHPSQIGSFEAGRKQAHKSPFAYGSVRTAAMLLDVLDGVPVTDRVSPLELIAPINRIARLQAVKCAPDDGGRGTPTSAMKRNCPPLLLHDELSILQPRMILTIGKPAEEAIRRLPEHRITSDRRAITRATVPLGADPCAIYSIAHPVSPAAWLADHTALKRHLRRYA